MLLVSLAAFALVIVQRSEASDTRGGVEDALATASAVSVEVGDRVAVTVNGDAILERDIRTIQAFSFLGQDPGGIDRSDREQVIAELTDGILLSQEAVRRGIAPGTDVAREELRRLSEQLHAMRDSDGTPEEIREAVDALFENGAYPDDLSSDQRLVAVFTRNLAAAAVQRAERDEVLSVGGSEDEAASRIEALVAALRAEADVVVYSE